MAVLGAVRDGGLSPLPQGSIGGSGLTQARSSGPGHPGRRAVPFRWPTRISLVSCTSSAPHRTLTSATAGPACLRTLVRASCTIRNAEISTAAGSRPGSPSMTSTTGSPAARTPSASAASSVTPGCGDSPGPAAGSSGCRSTPSSLRISTSACRPLRSIFSRVGPVSVPAWRPHNAQLTRVVASPHTLCIKAAHLSSKK